MNKKLIAIAVASVMAAPVAMADVKISGRIPQDFTSTSKEGGAGTVATDSYRTIGDSGQGRIQFDFGEGNAFARVAYDTRAASGITKRDNFIGYKFGAMKFALGRMPGAAKNLEKDPFIATFLQTRNTYAEAATAKQYGSSSFISNLAELSGKSGSVAWKVQYDATDNTGTSTNEGHLGLGVKGKAGGVAWWASYNTGTGSNTTGIDQTNTKVGASMKFGKIKATLNLTGADNGAATNNSWNAVAVSANMGLGNGASVDFTYASTSGDREGTYTRLAYANKLNKSATVYAGATISDPKKPTDTDAVTVFGAGMTVKF